MECTLKEVIIEHLIFRQDEISSLCGTSTMLGIADLVLLFYCQKGGRRDGFYKERAD